MLQFRAIRGIFWWGILMVTCYVRHAPLHSSPCSSISLWWLLCQIEEQCSLSYLSEGAHSISAKPSLNPASRASSRALTAKLPPSSGAPRHTPHTFSFGGFERTLFLFSLTWKSCLWLV